jgi:hypothetical protein
MRSLRRELRLLKIYALVSSVSLVCLICMAARSSANRTKFDVIDAERINIVEPDGKIRLTLANHERMPGGQLAGVALTARDGNRTMSNNGPQTAGLLFFNDEGDECGGLVYGNNMVDGEPRALVSLTFDHYRQNEAIGITHGEVGGASRSGVEVWDTGVPLTADHARQYNDALLMKDGPEKEAALKKIASASADESKFTSRLFVGRLAENNAAAVILRDTQGRARIRMTVDASGNPVLAFLDEHGKVIDRLPGSGENRQPIH